MNGLPSPGKLTDQIPNFITYEFFFKFFTQNKQNLHQRQEKVFHAKFIRTERIVKATGINIVMIRLWI